MNEKEILKMMDRINDDYLMEASAATKKNIKLKKRILTFAVAAALTASLSIGAFAAYKALNRESVGTYYDSSAMDKIEQSGYVSDVTASNEHFDMSLDTVVKDNYSLKAVVSVKALDEAAEKYLKRADAICGELVYSDTGEKVGTFADLLGMDNYEKGKAYPMRLTVSAKNAQAAVDLSRPLKLNFRSAEKDAAPADVELFKNLSLEFKDVKQSKSAKFTSPSGEVINVSEFTVSYDMMSQDEKLAKQYKSGDISLNADDLFDDLKIHYKDGKIEKLKEKINFISADLFDNEKYVMIIDLKAFIDPDAIDHIECKGVTYKR